MNPPMLCCLCIRDPLTQKWPLAATFPDGRKIIGPAHETKEEVFAYSDFLGEYTNAVAAYVAGPKAAQVRPGAPMTSPEQVH